MYTVCKKRNLVCTGAPDNIYNTIEKTGWIKSHAYTIVIYNLFKLIGATSKNCQAKKSME